MIPSGTEAVSNSSGECVCVCVCGRSLECRDYLEREGIGQPSLMKYCSLSQVVRGCL